MVTGQLEIACCWGLDIRRKPPLHAGARSCPGNQGGLLSVVWRSVVLIGGLLPQPEELGPLVCRIRDRVTIVLGRVLEERLPVPQICRFLYLQGAERSWPGDREVAAFKQEGE